MGGYLRLNPNSTAGGDFEFVRTDQVEFNTDGERAGGAGEGCERGVPDLFTGNVPTDGSDGLLHGRP